MFNVLSLHQGPSKVLKKLRKGICNLLCIAKDLDMENVFLLDVNVLHLFSVFLEIMSLVVWVD